MNDYLDIFSDVVLLATFQPRQRERYLPSRPGEDGPAPVRTRYPSPFKSRPADRAPWA